MNDMSDREVVYFALNMWKNLVETGDVHMSAEDAINIGKRGRVRSLNSDQAAFVARLNRLAKSYWERKP